ncbi:MAG: tail fiber domain-containing protein [Acidobacteria bacterium]|nr:tail fiber domain-containing protein [Acidobacteriota bacterium]
MKWRVGPVVLFFTLLSTAVVAEGPRPVSPGAQAEVAVVAGRCPTFHWTAVESAASVDLVVYRLPQEGPEGDAKPVLSVTLPGSAHGWTPALGQCLEPGQRYAWSVGAGGEWSEASLFEVSAVPLVTEVEEAMAVLRRYVETGEAATGTAVSAEAESRTDRPRNEQRMRREPKAERSQQPRALRSGSVGARPPPATVTPPGSYDLSISGDFDLGGYVFKDGYPLLHTDGLYSTALGLNALVSSTPVVSRYNTAVGHSALRNNTEGSRNTAGGTYALRFNTEGSRNTANGAFALRNNLTGSQNTATGFYTLRLNILGSYNTASGAFALEKNKGSNNTAVGYDALTENVAGDFNVAIGSLALKANTASNNSALGYRALRHNTAGFKNVAIGVDALYTNIGGDKNVAIGVDALRGSKPNRTVAIGYQAGMSVTYGNDNIFISHPGLPADNAVMRIGLSQAKTYIAGIHGIGIDGNTDSPVLIDSSGQLGTSTSSRRFKEDIRDMKRASRGLLKLRPVTFKYKKSKGSGTKPLRFGLIAEEVADVFPELVVYDDEGEPSTVRYHYLPSLLLNELQKQHRRIQVQGWLLGVMLLAGVGLTVGRWRLA